MDRQTLGATSPGEITRLLAAARQGDGSATERLVTLIDDELHAGARRQLRQRRPGQAIDPTVLVHDVYLRFVVQDDIPWHDRAHFFSVASLRCARS